MDLLTSHFWLQKPWNKSSYQSLPIVPNGQCPFERKTESLSIKYTCIWGNYLAVDTEPETSNACRNNLSADSMLSLQVRTELCTKPVLGTVHRDVVMSGPIESKEIAPHQNKVWDVQTLQHCTAMHTNEPEPHQRHQISPNYRSRIKLGTKDNCRVILLMRLSNRGKITASTVGIMGPVACDR